MPSTAPREGKLILTPAIPADAPRIAELHMAGFGNDPILLAAFPTPAVRDALQRDLEARTVREIGSSRMSVLVVRCVEYEGEEKHDEGRGVDGVEEGKRKSTVVSLAKWAHPMAEAEEGQHVEEQPRARPEGTVVRILERYHEELEKVQSKVIGKTPCYRLNFVATDPSYRRRGAATQLLQWGIERSKQEGVPIYLESTVEAGLLYEGLGFVLKGVIPLEFLREETGKEGIGESGKELCFLFVP